MLFLQGLSPGTKKHHLEISRAQGSEGQPHTLQSQLENDGSRDALQGKASEHSHVVQTVKQSFPETVRTFSLSIPEILRSR